MLQRVIEVYFEDGVDHGVGTITHWEDDELVKVKFEDGVEDYRPLFNLVFIF